MSAHHAAERELRRMRAGHDGADLAPTYRHVASCAACRARLRAPPASRSTAGVALVLTALVAVVVVGHGAARRALPTTTPSVDRAPDAWTMASF